MSPSLPMHTPAGSPDAWYQTVAPGGYEAWTVYVCDASSDIRAVVTLMAGCQYHPTYLDGYSAYLAEPTLVKPTLPLDWPCAHLVVVRGGSVLLESLTAFPRALFSASPVCMDVNVGLCRLIRLPDSIRLTFRGRPLEHGRWGPVHPKGLIHLELTLHTISKPAAMERVFGETTKAGEHRWGVVASPCTVKGELKFRVGASGPGETVAIGGRAAVEHAIGTRPIGDSFSAWMSGVAFLGRSVVPVRVACAKSRPAEAVVAVFDDEGRFCPIASTSGKTTWTRGKRAYPTGVDAGPVVRLDEARVVESRGPVMNVVYRATGAGGQVGQAVCQVIHPDALPRGARRMFLTPRAAQAAVVTSNP